MEERNIGKLCGYPVCSHQLGPVPRQKYHISVEKRQVFDLTERKVGSLVGVTLFIGLRCICIDYRYAVNGRCPTVVLISESRSILLLSYRQQIQ